MNKIFGILMIILTLIVFSGNVVMAECEADYQKGYQDGAQKCIENPALCGIIIGDTNNDGRIGLEDVIYNLQVLSGESNNSCNNCGCDSYKISHLCECDEEYAQLHPTECNLNFETIAGTWEYRGVAPEDSTRIWEGIRTFYANGTFEDAGIYNKGTISSDKNSGIWSLNDNQLNYSYQELWWNYSDGTSKHCWVTSWPNGICENDTSFTFAEGTANIEGNTHTFILTQSNGWIVTFIRK